MKRLMVLVLLGLFAFACAPPKEDIGAVRKQIEAMMDKAEKDLVSGVWDTTLTDYADDAISMPDKMPIVRGKKALREHTRQLWALGIKFTKVEFTTTDVFLHGPLAYEVGTYAMTMMIPGVGEMPEAGKYLTIYEKAPDGSWKIKVETWNTDKEPEMPHQGS